MKKRILSLLLAFCMLVALVPMATVTAEEDQTAENEIASLGTTYHDLYVTDGLVALFAGTDAASVDLENGKWYGYTVKDGKPVLSDSVFGTISGTDWTNASGLGYLDPDRTHASNTITFPSALLAPTFEVELINKVILREIAAEEDTAVKIAEPVDNGDGTVTYLVTRSYFWRSGNAADSAVTLHFSGAAGTVFTPVLMGGKSNADDMSTAVSASELTIGEDGTVTTTFKFVGTKLSVTLPEGVALTAMDARCGSDAFESQAGSAFVFGNLYGCLWSNLLGTNSWGNGYGAVRWNFATAPWNSHNGAAKFDGVSYFGNLYKDVSEFKTYNDKITAMSVTRDGYAYTLTHGAKTYAKDISASYTPEQLANMDGKQLLQVLSCVQGYVYSMRVYDRVLTDAEKKQNKAADIVAIYGLNVEKIDPAKFSGMFSLIDTLSAADYEGADAKALQAAVDLSADAVASASDYDKLYVQKGLVALYDAYSITAVPTQWVDKVYGNVAIVAGDNWAVEADGGFGYHAVYNNDNGGSWSMSEGGYLDNAITLPEQYAFMDNFTVETVLRLRAVENASGGQATATEIGTYNNGSKDVACFGGFTNTISAFRFDLMQATAFIGRANNGYHYRWFMTYGTWRNHNGKQNMTTTFALQQSDSTTDNTWVKTACTHNELQTLSASKLTDAATGDIAFSMTHKTTTHSRVMTAAQYASAQTFVKAENAGYMSLLTAAPGTVYVVRVYDRALTATEKAQNTAVDILAYYDANVDAIPDYLFGSMTDLISELSALKLGSTTTEAVQAIVDKHTATLLTVTLDGEEQKALPGAFTLPSTVAGSAVVAWNGNIAPGTVVTLTENAAYTSTVISVPETQDGASIRVDSTPATTGLRFTSTLSKEAYATIASTYGADAIKMGMLITPTAFVEKAGAFTKEALGKYATDNGKDATAGYVDIALNGYYRATDTDYILAASLVNLQSGTVENNIAFSAVLYLEIDITRDGIADTVIYGNCDKDTSRTVFEVADALKANIDGNVETGLDQEQISWFLSFYSTYWGE